MQLVRPDSTIRSATGFSILVGSSLWCNRNKTMPDTMTLPVSVSSSDRASGATSSSSPQMYPAAVVSVSSSDRASGATPSGTPPARSRPAFQYPRRIEPLVQQQFADKAIREIEEFQYPRRIEPLVQLAPWNSRFPFRSRFQYPRRIEPLVQPDLVIVPTSCNYLFQYPRRIEPLVQLDLRLPVVPNSHSFSILVGSSLWCNRLRAAGTTGSRACFSILVGSSLWCN